MKIDRSRFFLPGNVHARSAVLSVTSEEAAGQLLEPATIKRLRRALDVLRPDVRDCAAFRRLRRGEAAWPAAAVAEVLAVLAQRYVNWPVRFCGYRSADGNAATAPALQAQGTAIFQTTSARIGLPAAQAGFAIVRLMLEGAGRGQLRKAFQQELRRFLDATQSATPASDTLLLVGLAEKRGIPWQVVGRSRYVRIGLGRQTRIVKGTESTLTSSIGVAISRDKSVANKLLAGAGLPVARQRTARTEEAALAAAKDFGYPLVVKPINGNMGRDVTIGVSNEAELGKAFARAVTQADRAVIETFIPGEETRLLVAGGKFLAAVNRRPAQVTGDGEHSVAKLVEKENERPERDEFLSGPRALLYPLRLDDDALFLLSQQGLTVASVPEAGRTVLLRRESNVSRGATTVDVSDQVHPSIRRVAELAARALCLDVCGVDFVCPDISRPWQDTGGAICEVNNRPGMQMQILCASEERQDFILRSVFDALIGGGVDHGPPVVALVGTAETTKELRLTLETLTQRSGRKLGIVGTARKPTASGEPLRAAADLFKADDIDAALIVVKPGDLLEHGLGLSRIAAAVMPSDLGAQTAAVRKLLEEITRDAVSIADHPSALERAAAALGLPTDSLASTWPTAGAPMSPETDDNKNPDGTYTVLFAGDVGFGESYLHHRRMGALREILLSQGHEYSVSSLVRLLQSADHVIGNLEVPLSDRPAPALEGRKNYLGWCDVERTVAALREAGFDALSLANNHTLDCGAKGLAETIRRLEEVGIRRFGAGANEDDALMPHLHSFSVKGTRHTLVVFGGFEYRARYHREYRWYASPMVAGVGMILPRRIGEWIRTHGESVANPTFVAFPHWGTDYEGVTSTQRATASQLIDQGIDLIIGHGAHVAQPVEIVSGKTVVFNIGNFIWNTPGRFNHFGAPPYGVAAALRFDQGSESVPTLKLYPLMIDNEVTNFQNRPVTGTEVEPSLELLAHALPSRPQATADSIGHHLRLAI